MKSILRTIYEALLLGVVAVVLALGANWVRANTSIRGHLELSKNYFAMSLYRRAATPVVPPIPKTQSNQEVVESVSKDMPDDAAASDAFADRTLDAVVIGEYGYLELTTQQVVDVFNHDDTKMGLNLFLDARKLDIFEEGHIPGAIQADHYDFSLYIEKIQNFVSAAEKVIVYCNGGDCEDSIFMCRDLEDANIAHEKIYLFKGGWEAWTSLGMPVETGPEAP